MIFGMLVGSQRCGSNLVLFLKPKQNKEKQNTSPPPASPSSLLSRPLPPLSPKENTWGLISLNPNILSVCKLKETMSQPGLLWFQKRVVMYFEFLQRSICSIHSSSFLTSVPSLYDKV